MRATAGRPVVRLWKHGVLCVLALSAACGGSAGPAAGQAAPPSTTSGAVLSKLEGTWEIVRYESRDPIPNEAMPLMGEMFEDLRLSVHGGAWQAQGKPSPFEVVGDDSQSFRLKTGGMFDNASCKLTAEGQWEVVDDGPTWPGKTVLRRAH